MTTTRPERSGHYRETTMTTISIWLLLPIAAVAWYRDYRRAGELRQLREHLDAERDNKAAVTAELVKADATADYYRNALQQLSGEVNRIEFDPDLNDAAREQVETLAQAIEQIRRGAPDA